MHKIYMDNQEDFHSGKQAEARKESRTENNNAILLFQRVLMWIKIMRPQSWFAAVAPVLVGMMTASLQIHDERVDMKVEETLREAQFEMASISKDSEKLNGLGVVTTPDTTLLMSMNESSLHFNWNTAIVTLLCALDILVFANLVNDYYDFRKGADAKGRVGFRRALAEGIVSPMQMRRAIIVTVAVAVVTGLILVMEGGLPILLIGISGLFFAWLYTATRHSLAYMGIADLFVFIYFGVVATAGTTLLLADAWNWHSFLAGGVCGVISICVLACNNLRDRDDDARVGKRTLPVRFGKKAGDVEVITCTVLSLVFAWTAFGFSLPCLIVLPMAFLTWEIIHAHGAEYNRCLIHSGLCNMLFVTFVFIMFLIRM